MIQPHNNKLISLIHPSRGRPEKALTTTLDWIRGTDNIEHILSVDESDPLLNEYRKNFYLWHEAPNNSVVEATNRAAKIAKGDILVYLSDDFKCPDGWDVKIRQYFNTNEPRLLKVDDCLQRFDAKIITIPIMNRALYNLLGYFFNPKYDSMFVDDDLYHTCKQWIFEAPELKFPHEHWKTGKCKIDETYKRSEANWDQGLVVFNQRKLEGFPI